MATQLKSGSFKEDLKDGAVQTQVQAAPKTDYPPEVSTIPWNRSTKFQAAIVAGVFFCGPGMYSALNALGAGGLKSPHLVNITSGISYGLNVIFALLTGVFVNVLGERLVLSLGVVGFSINGASLYCNNKFQTTWLMYFASALQGFTTALLW